MSIDGWKKVRLEKMYDITLPDGTKVRKRLGYVPTARKGGRRRKSPKNKMAQPDMIDTKVTDELCRVQLCFGCWTTSILYPGVPDSAGGQIPMCLRCASGLRVRIVGQPLKNWRENKYIGMLALRMWKKKVRLFACSNISEELQYRKRKFDDFTLKFCPGCKSIWITAGVICQRKGCREELKVYDLKDMWPDFKYQSINFVQPKIDLTRVRRVFEKAIEINPQLFRKSKFSNAIRNVMLLNCKGFYIFDIGQTSWASLVISFLEATEVCGEDVDEAEVWIQTWIRDYAEKEFQGATDPGKSDWPLYGLGEIGTRLRYTYLPESIRRVRLGPWTGKDGRRKLKQARARAMRKEVRDLEEIKDMTEVSEMAKNKVWWIRKPLD